MVAWRTRNALGLDHFGALGGSAALAVTGNLNNPDNIIFDTLTESATRRRLRIR
jgi:hypothetical protein